MIDVNLIIDGFATSWLKRLAPIGLTSEDIRGELWLKYIEDLEPYGYEAPQIKRAFFNHLANLAAQRHTQMQLHAVRESEDWDFTDLVSDDAPITDIRLMSFQIYQHLPARLRQVFLSLLSREFVTSTESTSNSFSISDVDHVRWIARKVLSGFGDNLPIYPLTTEDKQKLDSVGIEKREWDKRELPVCQDTERHGRRKYTCEISEMGENGGDVHKFPPRVPGEHRSYGQSKIVPRRTGWLILSAINASGGATMRGLRRMAERMGWSDCNVLRNVTLLLCNGYILFDRGTRKYLATSKVPQLPMIREQTRWGKKLMSYYSVKKEVASC